MKNLAIIVLTISLFSCNTQKGIKADYEVRKNETFEVSLKANPSTGYSWKWIKDNSSKTVDSINSLYVQDKAEPSLTGIGGNEIWKFRGKEKGVYTLIFEYCRSWEPNSTVETKKIIVKIK
jgi:inhibitor of cysteine peptidase